MLRKNLITLIFTVISGILVFVFTKYWDSEGEVEVTISSERVFSNLVDDPWFSLERIDETINELEKAVQTKTENYSLTDAYKTIIDAKNSFRETYIQSRSECIYLSELHNKSNLKITNVTFKTKNSFHNRQIFDGKIIKKTDGETLNIGDVPPNQTAIVLSYSLHSCSLSALWPVDQEVFHDSGVANKKLRIRVDGSSFYQEYSKFVIILALIGFGFSIVLVCLAIADALKPFTSKKENDEKPSL